MRRFIVIFLLFLLPIQVLAESITDLSYEASSFHSQVEEAVTIQVTQGKISFAAMTDLSTSQQMEHADIHDSLNSAAQYSYRDLQFVPCCTYKDINQPLSYPPLRRPPRL